jgi:Zn-dependent protease with chaperone function
MGWEEEWIQLPRESDPKRILIALPSFVVACLIILDLEWEFHVIDSDEKNAFVLPGGKVFVFTG